MFMDFTPYPLREQFRFEKDIYIMDSFRSKFGVSLVLLSYFLILFYNSLLHYYAQYFIQGVYL